MTQTDRRKKSPLFISMRWRFILPLALILSIIAMGATYFLATRMTNNFALAEQNILAQSSQAVNNRAVSLYTRQRAEAQRVAYTTGIAESIIANDVSALHDSLEPLARTAQLDSIIVTDPAGQEVAGVLRVRNSDPVDYSISTQVDLSANPLVQAVIQNQTVGTSGLIQTPQGLNVYVGVPILYDGALIGVALVGQWLPAFITQLQASAVADLTLYNELGETYFTTFDLQTETLRDIRAPQTTITQTLSASAPVAAPMQFGTTRYNTLYTPLVYGEDILAVVATSVPDNVPFMSSIGRRLSSLFTALLAGVTVFATFIVIDRYANRLNRINKTAVALAQGERQARTQMRASDEIGRVGAALDTFADLSQAREDQLRTQLWRQRRERNHLLDIFEAIPEGIIVQDRQSNVVMINDAARQLIATQDNLLNDLRQFHQQLPQQDSASPAPGLYALGNPHQVPHDGRMLSAQLATVTSQTKQHVGTVILLRDMTDDVQKEQARAALLTQLSEDIQQPLRDLAHQTATRPNPTMQQLTREIARHAASLQKMIVSMRELTQYSPQQSQQMQRPIAAETLIYAVANDWRQIAQAAELTLRVMINQTGLHILGDESRLRWAIGNIVDNAIKYTPAGGMITIELKESVDNMLHMRIRDNGVGISGEDIKHVFMPFYRGTPLRMDGKMIRVPGMGQGLPQAQQVIHAHGGLMKVKSRVGVGSAVYLALPITSGAHFELPTLSPHVMDGETVQLTPDYDLDALWRSHL